MQKDSAYAFIFDPACSTSNMSTNEFIITKKRWCDNIL